MKHSQSYALHSKAHDLPHTTKVIYCQDWVYLHELKMLNSFFSLECYSCKMTGQDKRLYKNLNADGHSPNDLEALSPPESQLSVSPVSYMKASRSISVDEDENIIISSTCSRRTLFYLIATLNASFQDYDFSNAKSEEFSREPSLEWVINSINSNLSTAIGEPYAKMSAHLWSSIDEQISLQDCNIYRFATYNFLYKFR